LEQRVKSLKKVFAERAPNIELKGPYNTTGDPTKEFQIWSELVATNPDALGFVGVCSQDEEALGQIKRKQAGAEYLIAGTDESATTLKDIKEGVAAGTVGQNPYLQGYLSIYYLIQKTALEQSIPEGWINVGTEVVTPKNINEVLKRAANIDATREHYKPIIEEILANLRRRLNNDDTTELREAAEQQRQIVQIRLRKWLAE